VELESGLGGRRAGGAEPVEQLARVREKWELQWSPATDAQLAHVGAETRAHLFAGIHVRRLFRWL